jgi:undecaprenyl-diphosphatase
MWVFGGLAQDVIGTEEFFILDLSVIRYLDSNRIPALISVARVLNAATQPTVLVLVGALASGAALFVKRYRLIAAAVIAGLGQWIIVEITAALVDRTPPGVEALVARVDYGFPSEQVALVTAVAVVAVWPWTRPSWRTNVMRFGAAVMIVTLVGTSRVVLLVEYPSDVIAGAAVAAAWALLVCLAFDPGPASAPPVPTSDSSG